MPRTFTSLAEYLPKYDYMVNLTRRGWAYEHLRRHVVFQEAAYRRQEDVVSLIEYAPRLTLLKLRSPQLEAEAWGLIFFPNPDHTALRADLFWSDETFPNPIRVMVTPKAPGDRDELFERSVKACDIRHLTDCNGHEHLLVKGEGLAVQVRCLGASLLSASPMRMNYHVRGPGDVEDRYKAWRRAERVVDPVLRPVVWSERSKLLRNGLICLDAKDAGLNLRHAAEIIYGKKRVNEEWTPHRRDMKDKVRAWWHSAIKLRDGGYRALLQKGPW